MVFSLVLTTNNVLKTLDTQSHLSFNTAKNNNFTSRWSPIWLVDPTWPKKYVVHLRLQDAQENYTQKTFGKMVDGYVCVNLKVTWLFIVHQKSIYYLFICLDITK